VAVLFDRGGDYSAYTGSRAVKAIMLQHLLSQRERCMPVLEMLAKGIAGVALQSLVRTLVVTF